MTTLSAEVSAENIDPIEALLDAGLVTSAAAADVRSTSERTGSNPVTLLVVQGVVTADEVAPILADTWHIDYCDLGRTPWDHELVMRFEPEQLVSEEWFPLRRPPGEAALVATSLPPTAERTRRIEELVGGPVTFVATTEWDVQQAVMHAFRSRILDEACLGLWQRDADYSARVVLTRPQRISVIVALVVVVIGAIFFTTQTLVLASTVIAFGFLATVAFKFVVCLVGARLERVDSITDADVAELDERDLPVFTVLVPVFREANVVADLVANLSALDYPLDRLQILLLLEEDDIETIEAAKAARPPATITLRIVPKGHPQTKPKACNVGLFFARGDYLVIYDAEDRPDPDQLKKAVIAFRRGDESLVCVQAALNYWNDDENALTRMFTLEYSFWFDYMLPGLDFLNLPIPLGGTSNHFRTKALRELGGWDPFNVTEDADLGIRASATAHTVGVIRSTTYEEANRAYGNFIRQRSRWIKGYMQTALVHLRHPAQLVETVGWKRTLSFGLLIGGTPLTFLFTPPLLMLLVVSLMFDPADVSEFMPGWVLWAGLANLLLGNALMVYVSMMGAFRRRRYRLVMWALLNPVYWILHSIAAYKALSQLVLRPHYWEKTNHGLSTVEGARPSAPSSGPAGSAVATP